jgi:hypothetical protein
MSHLFMDLKATEYGAGDEGESVYGENADFIVGLGNCKIIRYLVTTSSINQWCFTSVVVMAMPFR